MGELQPDIAGYMASLGSTDEPLEICNSCQRALLYGAMMYAGSVKGELDQINGAIQGLDPVAGAQALKAATQHAGVLVEILAEFVKADFIGSLPGATELSEGDWAIAMSSFFQARSEHYVTPEGQIQFEPHQPDGGDPAEVAT